MALERLSDRSVITVELYPGGHFSGDSRYSYMLRRNEVIITQGGVHKGAAKWSKGEWVRERTSYSVTDQDMSVLRREAPNGPDDIRRVLKEGPEFRMRENRWKRFMV